MIHEFEWIRNVASRIKANIIKENSEFNKSEQSSVTKKFVMGYRSKKITGSFRDNMSLGAGSVAMRN